VSSLTPDPIAFVRESAWGRRLDPEQLQRVLADARAVEIEKGGYLVRAGDVAEYWVGFVGGLAVQQVSNEAGKCAVLAASCAGTWFGEGTLMKRGRWQYDAIARRRSQAVYIPYATFRWLLDNSLPFNQFVARLLNERLSHYMGLLANERLTNAQQRIAHVIASLYDPDLYPDRPAMLTISQADIALLSGMSRQRANSALNQLQDEGLLTVGRQGVRVTDLDGLRHY
jgi:CRP/FNR family transcriptional regulator, cyclic AMP receptor protein